MTWAEAEGLGVALRRGVWEVTAVGGFPALKSRAMRRVPLCGTAVRERGNARMAFWLGWDELRGCGFADVVARNAGPLSPPQTLADTGFALRG